MLGKLMKYEWKATWKLLVPMDLFVILMAILAYITVRLSFFDSDNYLVTMTGGIIILTYILSMFVIAVATMIYLIYRFYTSVYGEEGYLLHTLPVDKHHIIIAKSVVSAVWVILNIVIIYLSAAFLLTSQSEVARTIAKSYEYYAEIVDGGNRITAFSVVMTLLASFFALLARILKITACVSLGQLSSNHKVLASFGFYYGIYFIQRMFTVIYYVALTLMAETVDDGYASALLDTSWEFTMISSLIYCVIFYFLTWYMMDKKLNLD
ncbi:MAG: hypothetical protein NC318_01655 [Blautia sp.]|nr:hypothetical protein [Lachnoclostridium sp.]MCM1210287.1 hypothetical protein [Blautia sp.]